MTRHIRSKLRRLGNRKLALSAGVIFTPIRINVEWPEPRIEVVHKLVQIRKFGRRKTKTQYKRNNCLSPGGWRGYR